MASIHKTQTFLDTNVLVYSIDLSSENRDKHRAALETIRPNETEILCISPQILAEFYAVVTSSKSITNPISPQEAVSRIKRFSQMPNLRILPPPENLIDYWLPLLEETAVIGAEVFDRIHLATMLAYQIKRIYTFNKSDFNWYAKIQVIVPN
ncbi:PIN domain-containing protein [Euhalothece natronophila Z-M001]|uniref:PIN domain-containing protein n=1 Tax=Euhalothece natronophila Z-M001 TaxID=522448 RepID=A0A5B8NNA4_9CHRO|nr:PIN domain-containing protein [Euhalothece natronophila]QDZ39725.1 PIN domain-containing protein [Euhalothece natronophila Z-M001]